MDFDIIQRVLSSIIVVTATSISVYYGGLVSILFFSICFMFAIVEWYKISFAICAKKSCTNTAEVLKQFSRFEIYKFLSLIMIGSLYIFFGLFFMAFHSFFCDYQIVGYIVGICWITDTSAFISGRLMGGRKLAPHISPGKTWSGFLIGVLVGYISSIIFSAIFFTKVLWFQGLFICIISQLGDLLESFCKRKANIKDSGNIIPGHGGMLDRIDSILAASLFYFLFL
ncbi:phosphatidate cytidylyltransferase [Candidatus Gromoviella agglomerans]|uniref:phosphatidate cytidylyltransferase n=1 Tax=Candidatus Gromoviella agglomerans TaxID=2806609 RepID=UPI001E4DEFA1|nr:phosphatidate cytidylyltransferase [Candidatus Gromoviella agglomerans]UFX98468.1 Phosphatidate cytidylyltransferase [Candidatus Gromoviella agglomerans]